MAIFRLYCAERKTKVMTKNKTPCHLNEISNGKVWKITSFCVIRQPCFLNAHDGRYWNSAKAWDQISGDALENEYFLRYWI